MLTPLGVPITYRGETLERHWFDQTLRWQAPWLHMVALFFAGMRTDWRIQIP